MCKRNVILEENSFKGKKCLPFIMDSKYSINIDSEIDFKLAEIILNSQMRGIVFRMSWGIFSPWMEVHNKIKLFALASKYKKF